MNSKAKFSRRIFLGQCGSAVLASGAFPMLIPSSALSADKNAASNSRIAIGCIGVGERCQQIVGALLDRKDAQIVAICDVKRDALERTKARIDGKYQNTDCQTCGDFRDIVARKDIDAFVVASTDHWHVLHALAAVRAGKDVYLEKPLGLSLGEGQVLRREIQKRKRIFQFGTQQRSDRKFRLACELVRNGHIGKLKHINIWAPGSRPGGPPKQVPPPDTLNYDFWLGPAPVQPYTENLTAWEVAKKTWWFNSDYALGFIAGWGIHPMDIALWGAGDLVEGKVEVEGKGNFPKEGICDTATTWDINFKFQSGLTMRFVGIPNKSPEEKFEQKAEWEQRYRQIGPHGTVFEGSEGWVHVDREHINLEPESLIDLDPEEFKIHLTRSSNHAGNFLDSIRSRKPTVCPIEEGVRSDAFCHLSDIAIRLKRKLIYDIKKEKFVDCKEANQRLAVRAFRQPWTLAT
jgi:predicted dehydrogenase